MSQESLNEPTQERIVYLDLLRIFAVFSVMILHVSGYEWSDASLGTTVWQASNFYNSCVRFSVPIFVMISGCFFLNPNKNITIKSLFTKNILRIVTAFCFWSFAYTYYHFSTGALTTTIAIERQFIFGNYHLWYLYMICGLYMISPFLRSITKKDELSKYFLILSFVFAICLRSFKDIPSLQLLSEVAGMLQLNFVLGYSFYFVLGYYLYKHAISKKTEVLIYILGISSVVITMFGTNLLSIEAGEATSVLYSFLSPNVSLATCAVFVFFKNRLSKTSFINANWKIIRQVSNYTFGMYLVHDFFNILFKNIGLTPNSFNPYLSIIFISIMVFTGSLFVSIILSKIPIVKSYLM